MYSVRNVNGKGLGCIANSRIKRGTLIEKEAPVLETEWRSGRINEMWNSDSSNDDRWIKWTEYHLKYAPEVIEKFIKMEKKQKEEYLKLSNKYKEKLDQDHPYIVDLQQFSHNTLQKFFPFLDLGEIDVETALQVYEIFDTNAFHNGVFLKMSRFNHSCIANAEYFWNTTENVREIRSISNIEDGEEITISYGGLEVEDTRVRRENLSRYHFHCNCPACNLSKENLEEEKKICQNFRELEEKSNFLRKEQNFIQTITNVFNYLKTRNEVDCYKQMYQIAKKLKTLKIKSILNNIVEIGFDASCQGYYNMNKVAALTNLPDKGKFLIDSQNFASVGLKLSLLIHGKENKETMDWEMRKADPIAFFEKEYVKRC